MSFERTSCRGTRLPTLVLSIILVWLNVSCARAGSDVENTAVPKEAVMSAVAAVPFDSLCAGRDYDTVIVDPAVLRIPHAGGWDDGVPTGQLLEAGDVQFLAHGGKALVMSEFTAAVLERSTMGVMVAVVEGTSSDSVSVIIDMYWPGTFGTAAVVEVVSIEGNWHVQSVSLWES